jgi:glycosyltransferase involved in cell wall biosynthesis
MSVYNGEKYVEDAIESILEQTYQCLEIIIIDDGSTDKTYDILQKYINKKVKVYQHKNIGLTKSLNKGIKLSTGKYIARIDADEVAIKTRIEKQVKFLDRHHDVGVVGTFCRNIDEKTGNTQCWTHPINNRDIRKGLTYKNVLVHGSVMIRREVFDTVGLYDEKYSYVQDYELWGRVRNKYKLHNIPEILLIRKVTENSLSQLQELKTTRALFSLRAQVSIIRNSSWPMLSYAKLTKNLIYYCWCIGWSLARQIEAFIKYENKN